MRRVLPLLLECACLLVISAASASAQTFDTVGTRAAGMAGAFVAVADDASAAYWNPGGFAAGNFFKMVLDRSTAKVNPGTIEGGDSASGVLVALGIPALGLSYYRLRSTTLWTGGQANPSRSERSPGVDELRMDTLITHHSGVTLVQSIARGVAIGTTLKVVRGVAASAIVADTDREGLLGRTELTGKGTSKFDADIGIMAAAGLFKAGVTVRNLTQPGFTTGRGGPELSLDRQARAGIAIAVRDGWAVAADLDLTRGTTPAGRVRDFALGTEGRLGRKAFVRGGLRLNTAAGGGPSVAAGASYAVMGSVLVDAQVTGGSDRSHRGWGVAARFVY
jgi:hypothetical protein